MSSSTAISQNFFCVLHCRGRAPEYLRLNQDLLAVVRHFADAKKPIASICHGAQILAAAGVISGRKLTCYPACGPEVAGCGGELADVPADEVVVDGNLVSGPAWPSHPKVMAAFIKALGYEVTRS